MGTDTFGGCMDSDPSAPEEQTVAKLKRELKGKAVLLSELSDELERVRVCRADVTTELAATISEEFSAPMQSIYDSAHFVRDALMELRPLLRAYSSLADAVAGGQGADVLLARVRRLQAGIDADFVEEELGSAVDAVLTGARTLTDIVAATGEIGTRGGPAREPGDVNAAVQSAVMLARRTLGHVFAIEVDLADLPVIDCNLDELGRVFGSLLNATARALDDVSSEGSARVRISTRALPGRVVVSISDNGPGLSAHDRREVFEVLNGLPARALGLAHVHRTVVVDHGGMIRVRSDPGSGTTFFLELPICAWTALSEAA